ncbi:MAG: hypothetical protein HYR70_03000 [Chloroflexi bacterium]|nr:hypothetical protein [Chloroflexota bacterium]MBI1855781.1 hypothetical protein [Chloroflexota bacterium]MBI2757629.1 hypothetical protein [Chloroflexota bacterium]MBI3339977.1 hypothetical protein [Chloroflexota bacterium]
MGLKRNVGLAVALRYKGKTPFWSYILHRIGGSALFTFFTIYIMALAGVDFASGILGNWLFQIFSLSFGLFHIINGLRITILDLFPNLIRRQREAIWLEWAVFLPLYGFMLFVVFRSAVGG